MHCAAQTATRVAKLFLDSGSRSSGSDGGGQPLRQACPRGGLRRVLIDWEPARDERSAMQGLGSRCRMHELSFPDKRERPPLQTGMATPVCSALTGVTLDME